MRGVIWAAGRPGILCSQKAEYKVRDKAARICERLFGYTHVAFRIQTLWAKMQANISKNGFSDTGTLLFGYRHFAFRIQALCFSDTPTLLFGYTSDATSGATSDKNR